MDPEFLEAGLVHEASGSYGLAVDLIGQVPRIMSRSCWLSTMCVSQVGSNCAWADTAIMNPATTGITTLSDCDMVDYSKDDISGSVQRICIPRTGKEKETGSPGLDLDQRSRSNSRALLH
jgi:hypothetical protein